MTKRLRGFYFLFLLFVLAWAPLPLGSNRPWSWSLLEALIFVLLGARALHAVLVRRPGHVTEAWPAALWMAWVAMWLIPVYLFIQTIVIPPAVLEALHSGSVDYYRYTRAFPEFTGMRISVDPRATVGEALKAAAYAGVFSLVIVLVTRTRRLLYVALVLIATGVLEALYGIGWFLQHRGAPDVVAVTGTFVNQNHFAGMMEMSLALAVGLWLGTESRGAAARSGLMPAVRGMVEFLTGYRFWLAASMVVMAAALMLTASRGGVLAFCGALGAVLIISSAFRFKAFSPHRMLVILVAVLLLALMLFGANRLQTKLLGEQPDANRELLRAHTLEMFAASPAVGYGAGTFRWVLPAFRDVRTGKAFYEHAHNDYLEWLAETGVVGAVLAIMMVLPLYLRGWLGLLNETSQVSIGIRFGALVGVTALLVHSLVDFNLRIPANAIWFFALLGILQFPVRRARGADAPAGATARSGDFG